jgi:protease I
MPANLEGKRVAILATDGFEESELLEPRKALRAAGATAEVVSLKAGRIKGWKHTDWGASVDVDRVLAETTAEDYDALMLPGGVMNPDRLRTERDVVSFIQDFFVAGKPVGAICHGPWTLIEADVIDGRRLTSWPSLKTDIRNAGGEWVDAEVVTDRGLVTSRKPDDLPAFNRKLIEEIAEGSHDGRKGRPRAARQSSTEARH